MFTEELDSYVSTLSGMLLEQERTQRQQQGSGADGADQPGLQEAEQLQQRHDERKSSFGHRLHMVSGLTRLVLRSTVEEHSGPTPLIMAVTSMMGAMLGIGSSGEGSGSSSSSSGCGNSSSSNGTHAAPAASATAAATAAAAATAFFQELVDSGVLEWAARCVLVTSAALAPYCPYTQAPLHKALLGQLDGNPRAQLVLTCGVVECVTRLWMSRLLTGLTLPEGPGASRSARAIRQPLARALAAGRCPCLSHLLSTQLVGLCVALGGGPDYGLPSLTAAWRAVEAGAAADLERGPDGGVHKLPQAEQLEFVLRQQRAGDAALVAAAADGEERHGLRCSWLRSAAAPLLNEEGGRLGELQFFATGGCYDDDGEYDPLESGYMGFTFARAAGLHAVLHLWTEALAAVPGLLTIDGDRGSGEAAGGGSDGAAERASSSSSSGSRSASNTSGSSSSSSTASGSGRHRGGSRSLLRRQASAMVDRLWARMQRMQAQPPSDAAAAAIAENMAVGRRVALVARECQTAPPLNTPATVAVCMRLLAAAAAHGGMAPGVRGQAKVAQLAAAQLVKDLRPARPRRRAAGAAAAAAAESGPSAAPRAADAGAGRAGAGATGAGAGVPSPAGASAACGGGLDGSGAAGGAAAEHAASPLDPGPDERPMLALDGSVHLARAALMCSKAALLDMTAGAAAAAAAAARPAGRATAGGADAASPPAAAERAEEGSSEASSSEGDDDDEAAASPAPAGPVGLGSQPRAAERLWVSWWGAALYWVQVAAPPTLRGPGVRGNPEALAGSGRGAGLCAELLEEGERTDDGFRWQWWQVHEVLALVVPPGTAVTAATHAAAADADESGHDGATEAALTWLLAAVEAGWVPVTEAVARRGPELSWRAVIPPGAAANGLVAMALQHDPPQLASLLWTLGKVLRRRAAAAAAAGSTPAASGQQQQRGGGAGAGGCCTPELEMLLDALEVCQRLLAGLAPVLACELVLARQGVRSGGGSGGGAADAAAGQGCEAGEAGPSAASADASAGGARAASDGPQPQPCSAAGAAAAGGTTTATGAARDGAEEEPAAAKWARRGMERHYDLERRRIMPGWCQRALQSCLRTSDAAVVVPPALSLLRTMLRLCEAELQRDFDSSPAEPLAAVAVEAIETLAMDTCHHVLVLLGDALGLPESIAIEEWEEKFGHRKTAPAPKRAEREAAKAAAKAAAAAAAEPQSAGDGASAVGGVSAGGGASAGGSTSASASASTSTSTSASASASASASTSTSASASASASATTSTNTASANAAGGQQCKPPGGTAPPPPTWGPELWADFVVRQVDLAAVLRLALRVWRAHHHPELELERQSRLCRSARAVVLKLLTELDVGSRQCSSANAWALGLTPGKGGGGAAGAGGAAGGTSTDGAAEIDYEIQVQVQELLDSCDDDHKEYDYDRLQLVVDYALDFAEAADDDAAAARAAAARVGTAEALAEALAARRNVPAACANPACANLQGPSELELRLPVRCRGCGAGPGAAQYCGRECAVEHWRAGHKAACRGASAAGGGGSSTGASAPARSSGGGGGGDGVRTGGGAGSQK
ncbi:hypothetical protein HXX76_012342 [Chlamydomonas incerta]|uniref:MYND-type domain-containing protein n=1 Tax=Chlamydomonas incerta TaxID=51695 RepID=A0A835VW78_CHLIN|nr:hypothetical protein HXX76_012342 [Chlamydomonas incerta]|eukprot:KAG2427406.1 hypothetical protein HXX76_012342 [Chlamydomonas incerta]